MRCAVALVGACLVWLALTTGCSAQPVARSPFPARPFSIAVGSVDPCAGLSPEQRARLKLLEGRPRTSQGGTSRGCTWIDRAGRSLNLQTFPTPATSALGPGARMVAIAGFGAVQSTPDQSNVTSFCQVVVDVADDASLRAQLEISPSALSPPDDGAACSELRDITAGMLDTLRARQTS